jgi:hypothetical protein
MQLSPPSVRPGVLDSDKGGVVVDVEYRQQHVPKWRLLSEQEELERGATSRFVPEHQFPSAVNVGFRLLDWRAFEQHRRHVGRSGNNNIKQVDFLFIVTRETRGIRSVLSGEARFAWGHLNTS